MSRTNYSTRVFLSNLVLLSSLATSVISTPTTPPCSSITASQIIQISPNSTTCNATAQFADECRTAEQATPFVNAAFDKYGIATPGEQAALLSLMLFESGGFQFNRNHFPPPGRPGQGTRSLLTFPFIMQYAQDTPSTAAQANQIAPNPSNATPDQMNSVLALVLGDDLSFASGSWFYTTLCNPDIIAGVRNGSVTGWENYITNCVGTDVTEQDRRDVYFATRTALGLEASP